MSQVSTKNKSTIIRERILEGGATKAILMEVAEVNPAGFASQLSYLRMQASAVAEVAPEAAKFPMVNDQGEYYMASYEAFLAAQASKGKGGVGGPKTRTTADALAFAQKREDSASKAYTKAQEKSIANPDDEIYRLTAELKRIDLDIASRKLGFVEQGNTTYESFVIDDSKAEEGEAVETEETDDVEADGLI